MGTLFDMNTRKEQLRVDDDAHRKKIAKARKLIFKHGASINGVRVQSLLQDGSFVPTKVSEHFKHHIVTDVYLERFL